MMMITSSSDHHLNGRDLRGVISAAESRGGLQSGILPRDPPGWPNGDQLCWEGPVLVEKVSRSQQSPCGQEGQWYPGMCWEECGQQVKGDVRPHLEYSLQLWSPVQKRQGATRVYQCALHDPASNVGWTRWSPEVSSNSKNSVCTSGSLYLMATEQLILYIGQCSFSQF